MVNYIKTGRILLLSVFLVAITVCAFAQGECTAIYGMGSATMRLATGSPGELGLVEVLANAFNESHDSRLCWKKAGSGASLK